MQVNTPYMDAMGIIKVGVILSHHEPHSLAQEFCWPAGKPHFLCRIIGYRKVVVATQIGWDMFLSTKQIIGFLASELNPFFCHE